MNVAFVFKVLRAENVVERSVFVDVAVVVVGDWCAISWVKCATVTISIVFILCHF